MSMWDRLATIERRFEELTAEMGRPEVAADHERLQALARERASFEEVVTLYRQYRAVDKALGEAKTMADGNDAELVALAKDEVATLSSRHEDLEERLKQALLPRDPLDERNVIMEVRAGTGGDEAALFAADLYRMYSRYAD